jgi:hypothetical protein
MRLRAAAVAMVSVLLAAPTARGGPRADTASLTAKGVASMEAGEFEAALRHLDAAAASGGDDTETARIHLLRARCFAALRDFAKVEAALGRALEYDPEVSLDPERTPPRLVALLDQIRKRLQGTLRVSADASARVLADGKLLGSPPFEASLPIGRARIEVRDREGHLALETEVVVRPNRPTELFVPEPQPKPSEPKLSAQAPPSGPPVPQPVPPAQVQANTTPALPPDAEAGHQQPSGLGWTAEGRALLDPGWGVAFEAGGGVGGRHWRATLDATFGAAFGLTARGTATFPDLIGPAGFYVSADVPVFLYEPVGVGLGGSVGVGVKLVQRLEVFIEGAGRWFVSGPSDFKTGYLLVAAGVRWRPD